MSNINEPFVNDGGRFEVVFASLASARYQLRLSILGTSTVAKMYFVTLSIQRCNCLNTLGAFLSRVAIASVPCNALQYDTMLFFHMIRYDTIREAILSCARKLT